MRPVRFLAATMLIVGFILAELKHVSFLVPRNENLTVLLAAIGETFYFPGFFLLLGGNYLRSPRSPVADPTSYGGVWFRFVAGILDLGFFSMLADSIGRVFVGLMRVSGSNSSVFRWFAGWGSGPYRVNLILLFLLGLGVYYVLTEGSRLEASFGKIALKLRVTDLDGRQISFARATLRYFGKILSLGTFLIGFIVGIFTARKQTLHDFLAKTVVVDA